MYDIYYIGNYEVTKKKNRLVNNRKT